MMIEKKNISFAILKITTEQFAIIEDNYKKDGIIKVGTSLRFGAVRDTGLLAVFVAFTFESDQKPFIVVEAGCHFQVRDDAWDGMFNHETNSLVVPKGFLSHLATLTIGTTRGILHAKTENTTFNTFVVPAINISDLIREDAILRLMN